VGGGSKEIQKSGLSTEEFQRLRIAKVAETENGLSSGRNRMKLRKKRRCFMD
jgi:hypothetical protein